MWAAHILGLVVMLIWGTYRAQWELWNKHEIEWPVLCVSSCSIVGKGLILKSHPKITTTGRYKSVSLHLDPVLMGWWIEPYVGNYERNIRQTLVLSLIHPTQNRHTFLVNKFYATDRMFQAKPVLSACEGARALKNMGYRYSFFATIYIYIEPHMKTLQTGNHHSKVA